MFDLCEVYRRLEPIVLEEGRKINADLAIHADYTVDSLILTARQIDVKGDSFYKEEVITCSEIKSGIESPGGLEPLLKERLEPLVKLNDLARADDGKSISSKTLCAIRDDLLRLKTSTGNIEFDIRVQFVQKQLHLKGWNENSKRWATVIFDSDMITCGVYKDVFQQCVDCIVAELAKPGPQRVTFEGTWCNFGQCFNSKLEQFSNEEHRHAPA